MPTIIITAADTLFFGTGRPFTMGEDSWTKGMFPPNPETLYGFLRGCYFLDHNGELDKANTPSDPTKDLRVINYGLLKLEDNAISRLFAWPLDLVINHDKKSFVLPLVYQPTPILTNCALQTGWKLMETSDEKLRKPKGMNFLTETDFQNYLMSKYDELIRLKLSDLIVSEPKIGIFRNRFDSNEKELYRLQMNRLETKTHQVSLWIEFDGLKLPNSLINRLGGEGKLVFVNETDQTNNNVPIIAAENDIIRMYLNSPALLGKGWLPEIDGAQLLAATIGNPMYISGFDIKSKWPKPTVKAVPSGSVYYFKILTTNCSLPTKIGNGTKKGFGTVTYSKITI